MLTAALLPPALLLAAPAEREALAMGTRLTLSLEGPDAGRVTEALLSESDRIEAAGSTWRPDTPFSRLNAAQGQAVALAPEWLDLLERVQAWSRKTEGAFDPVLMALLRAWDTRGPGRVPTTPERATAREACGANLLELDRTAGTARLRHPAAGLEEGGFLKGYALDRMRAMARAQGIRAGLLDFGGQLLAWGHGRTVAIADSRQRDLPAVKLRLIDASLSTSGCSERGRHLLDPRTGAPAPNWGAVSVVHPEALVADLLSTALYVMGPDHGLAFAQQGGFAALFQPHGQRPRATAAFLALNPTFLVKETP